jgi:hypothetical protein
MQQWARGLVMFQRGLEMTYYLLSRQKCRYAAPLVLDSPMDPQTAAEE